VSVPKKVSSNPVIFAPHYTRRTLANQLDDSTAGTCYWDFGSQGTATLAHVFNAPALVLSIRSSNRLAVSFVA